MATHWNGGRPADAAAWVLGITGGRSGRFHPGSAGGRAMDTEVMASSSPRDPSGTVSQFLMSKLFLINRGSISVPSKVAGRGHTGLPQAGRTRHHRKQHAAWGDALSPGGSCSGDRKREGRAGKRGQLTTPVGALAGGGEPQWDFWQGPTPCPAPQPTRPTSQAAGVMNWAPQRGRPVSRKPGGGAAGCSVCILFAIVINNRRERNPPELPVTLSLLSRGFMELN